MPRKRGANGEGKMEKSVYVTALVDTLRAVNGNDYEKVRGKKWRHYTS